MGENLDPLTTDSNAKLLSHRGILGVMAVVVIAGTIAGFTAFSSRAGFGVFVGGILAFANYFWQKHSLKAIFDRAVSGKKSRFLAVRYILRYVILAGAVAVIYMTDLVSIYAVIFGLASFAIAVVIEGFTSIFSSSKDRES
jgi:hypothetical protein